MPPRSSLLLLALLLATPASAEKIEHRGVTFWVYRLDPKKTKLELHLSAERGEPNTFPDLSARVGKTGRRLVFATNSGIFEGNFLPTGLHIAEGKAIVKLNREDFVKEREGQFTPNFFLKPNGVFFIAKNGAAGVLETEKYRKATGSLDAVLATQSGPLLVENGRIHPVLTEDSTSVRFRNGVGVTKDGTVVFACSVLEVGVGESNLYRFGELFRDRLGCPDALYLDGDISYFYIRGETPPIERTNWFAGILAVTEPVE